MTWASSRPDLYFACPNCLDKDRIDFTPNVHVRCEACSWKFDFKKCKTVNQGHKSLRVKR